jgi:hypothetical protein
MQLADFPAFEQAFARLCAAFDTPPTQARKDAYWQAFRKVSPAEFLRIVDSALTDSTFESMPTVGSLREVQRRRESAPIAREPDSGPSIQAQLCEYVMLTHPELADAGNVNPDRARQRALPWTYLYREWRENGKRFAECVGVAIPAGLFCEGFRVMVADMLADTERHAYALKKLSR